MKIAWATDVHFDHSGMNEVKALLQSFEESKADVFLVGGDISDSINLRRHLAMVNQIFNCPVYFVLGNHDAYGSSIAVAEQIAKEAAEKHDSLHWLDRCKPMELTSKAVLIGTGGWCDAQAGDFFLEPTLLNDYSLINELRFQPSILLKDTLRRLGIKHAKRIAEKLKEIPDTCEEIWVLTHVPPWREACWHDGKLSDDMWVPHFSCLAVGEVLEKYMEKNPDKKMTVLSGHTHGEGRAEILPNLLAITGKAVYGHPSLAGVFEI